MKRLFILLITAFFLMPLAQASNQKALKDSLLRAYHYAPADSTRLQTLYQLAVIEQQNPAFIYYANKLLEEAEAQKDLVYQSAALYLHMIYYYNQIDQEHTEQWYQRLKAFTLKHKLYRHYFRGQKMMVELYIIHQQNEFALNLAQEMYAEAERLNDQNGMREACVCMMTSLFNVMQYKEGIEYLEKAFKLLSPEASNITRLDLYTKGVISYSYLRNNEKMYYYLEELNKIRAEILAEDPDAALNGFINVFLFIDLEYALYYTRAGQPKEAWASLQEAEKCYTPNSFLPYKCTRLGAYAEYYQLTKEYDKAIYYLDQAIDLSKPISPDDAVNYGFQKAKVLSETGRYDEAVAVYGKVTAARDSLSSAFSNSQIKQIESMSNMEEMLVQKDKRRAIYHRICLAIVIVVLLMLIPSNFHAFRNQRRLRRDEKEVRKLAQVAEEANDMKGRFLTNMSYNIRISLNNVVGFSQLLSTDENLTDEERQEYSAIVQAHSGQLIQLVNDVLDLSRLEANMMKYQMMECTAEEWVNEISCMVQMRSEGIIKMEMTADVADARINADTGKLTQYVMNMSLYPVDCKEPRTVKMSVKADAETHMLVCRIENSTMADPKFASQKISVRHDIHRLFFEHFGGIYEIGKAAEGEVPAITFTYPTL